MIIIFKIFMGHMKASNKAVKMKENKLLYVILISQFELSFSI